MAGALIIKKKIIDAKHPMVCVPIVEETADAILWKAREMRKAEVPMVEWRMDYFRDLSEQEEFRKVAESLRDIFSNQVLLFTYRTRAEGGEGNLSGDYYMEFLREAAALRCADLLDVEYDQLLEAEKFAEELHDLGALLVVSHHDFHVTPSGPQILLRLEKMKDMDADVVKLAVMPESKKDAAMLLAATAEFSEKYPSLPLITMSMGEKGAISRAAGCFFGSCVSFASFDKASAPGQMDYETTVTLVDQIKELM